MLRLVLDLLREELATSRGRSSLALGVSAWNETTRLVADGLDLDSLERLNATAALNEFFHLHEYGAEDYLLTLPTVGEWCDLVEQSLAAHGSHLTFRTSGTAGVPKRCTHAVADLMVEVETWSRLLTPAARIVNLVPSHHIYGTIFTALLPDHLGVDCVDARSGGANIMSRCDPGTVVVGTPTMWAYLARSLTNFPEGLTGVTSTAPMPSGLADQLSAAGLGRLIEIYGSSETGGIGYRLDPDAPYALLDHWARETDSDLARASVDGRGDFTMMDTVTWEDAKHFCVTGRHDGAVQVGGYNVFPEQIQERLLQNIDVADAYVRFEPATGRLKAFVVPSHETHEGDGFVANLDAWCSITFKDAERPRAFTIGTTLPRSAMGKLCDW